MNTISIIGRVGQDIELKEIGADNKKAVSFSIAESTGKDTSAWWHCQAWGATAEFIAAWVKKGDKICCIGRLDQREYEKDGQKKTAYQITVREIDPFLNGKRQDTSQNTSSQNAHINEATNNQAINSANDDDDLPF